MKYRAEIDGLRAISVISIILFHADFDSFKGGYIGVDIFFVISGYLITTIVIDERERDTFSLTNFYIRRARRILPPLYSIMLITLVFTWFYFLPKDFKNFSQSLMAVSSFTSNIFFWKESGYWGAASELKPMLHTWSLSIEEQYYIIFPLMIAFLWKLNKLHITIVFIVITSISLILAQWGAYNKPSANFFLLPTRFWELSIGTIIAFYKFYWESKHTRLTNELFGFIGVSLIFYSLFTYNDTTPFPSLFTLLPTLGAGLIIIFSSKKSFVGIFLSQPILVNIGLMSYSLYLWHQPLLAVTRQISLTQPNKLTYAIIIIISFFLAYFTHRFIEKPFRNKKKISLKIILIYSISGATFFIFSGYLGYITNGFENRYKQDYLVLEDKVSINQGLSDVCDKTFTLSQKCRTSNNPEILIWGDSYAMHLVQGILSSNPQAKVIQMTKSSCAPFFNLSQIKLPTHSKHWANTCLEFNMKVKAWLKNNNTVKYVVISSPFYEYISGKGNVLSNNGNIYQNDILLATQEFKETLNELLLMGIRPIIFSPPPTNGNDLGRCLIRAEMTNQSLNNCDFKPKDITGARLSVYKFLLNFENKYKIVNLQRMICNQLLCKTHIKSNFIFRDSGHLSKEGSALLGKEFDFYHIITNSSVK